MNQAFSSLEVLSLSLLCLNALMDAVLHKFKSNFVSLSSLILYFCSCVFFWFFFSC